MANVSIDYTIKGTAGHFDVLRGLNYICLMKVRWYQNVLYKRSFSLPVNAVKA